MAGGYERVLHDDAEDIRSAVGAPREMHPLPNSPPPSFHSATPSSLERRGRVDQDLADAFGDDDDSEDESDDRQRLVRGNSTPAEPANTSRDSEAAQPTTHRNGYQSVPQPTGVHAGRVYGGGSQGDGVFSNMAAKPERDSGEKDEMPPTYEQAAADQAPPYWETTILAPGMGGPDEVYIDGLPVGSFFSFVWNAIISWSFQIPGFLLTYLLHSTHAAKNGSRLGLGITMIQFGLGLKFGSDPSSGGRPSPMPGPDGYSNPSDPNSHDFDPDAVTNGDGSGGGEGASDDISGLDWLMYVLMVVGWYIFIRAIGDYIEARRHERLVLQSPDRGLGVAVVAEGESPERAV